MPSRVLTSARVVEHPFGVVPARDVVVGLPRGENGVTVRREPLDQVGPEKAPATGDEDPHEGPGALAATVGFPVLSQSTRPIQRSLFAAYHAIVLAIPSFH